MLRNNKTQPKCWIFPNFLPFYRNSESHYLGFLPFSVSPGSRDWTHTLCMLGKHSTTELHLSPSLFPLRQSFPVQSRLALNPRSLMTQPSCGWFMNTQGHDMPDSSSLIWADKLLNSQQPITITLVRVPGCPELWLTGSQWPCSSQGCNGRLRECWLAFCQAMRWWSPVS